MKKMVLGWLFAFLLVGCASTPPNDPTAINDALIGFTVNSQGELWHEAILFVTPNEADEISDENGLMKQEYRVAASRLRISALRQMPWRVDKKGRLIGIKAVHLTTAAERRMMPKTKDLYIDIGAASKAAAEKLVSLGDYGVFDSAVVEFGDGLIKAKAIDDRVGCAALLKLIEDEPPIDTWFCFTVQEEVGLRGAASMAYALDPGIAMVLEGTTAADLAEVEGGKAVCRVRGGVVLPFMDGATIYDAELFELLRDACIKRGIPWQTKTRVAGGTDAGRIHKSRAGVRVCAAAAPVRYIHSPSSVAAAADCEAVLSAARAFLEELGGDDE